jgi:hypothetical protein
VLSVRGGADFRPPGTGEKREAVFNVEVRVELRESAGLTVREP